MATPSRPSDSLATPPEPSQARRWLKRGLIGVSGLAVLYLGSAFLLSRFLDPEALADWMEPRLETALARDVEIERVEVGFLPLGVRLRNLTVADPTGLAPELARVSSVDLRVAVLPLLRRQVQVSRLTVEGLRAHLQVSEQGVTNFGDLSTRQPDPEGPAEPGEMPDSSEAGRQPSDTSARSNEDSAAAPEGSTEGGRPFALDLRGLRMTDGVIQYRDHSKALEATVASIRVRAAARRGSDGDWILVGSTDGALTLISGERAPLLDEASLALTFDLAADQNLETLRSRTGELKLGNLALALTGEVSDLQGPMRTVALDLSGEGLPLPDLLALLPDSIRRKAPVEAEGSLTVDLSVDGQLGPGTVPDIQGRIRLEEGGLTLDGSRFAEDLSAELNLRADRSVETRAQASVLGGPFSVDGRVSLGDPAAPSGEARSPSGTANGPRIDLVIRANPDLSGLASVVELPEGVTAQGRLPSEVRIMGPVGSLRDMRFRGNVGADGVRATHPSLGVPIRVPTGQVELSGMGARLADLPVILGEDRILVSGEIADLFAFLDPESTPRFDGSARGHRLDLRKLSTRPLPDSTLTYGKVAFAKVGGRQVSGRSVEDAARELGLTRPESLPLAGTVDLQVDTVIDRQGQMEDLQARVDFGPGFLRVSDATFRRFGGEIRTAGDLTLAPEAGTPFSFSLQVRDLDAGAFLSNTTPLGRFVRGRITLQLDLVGTLDGFLLPDRPSLVGSGSFSLTGGGLATAPLTQRVSDFLGIEALREPAIRDWSSSFFLDQGRVGLADATLQGAPGSPQVGGSVGLDGALDLRSAFNLPTDRLNPATMERLGIAGEIMANVAQRPDVVQAILRIGGSVFDPSIQADPAAAARTLGQAVGEEVRREAQEQIDAQAAEARKRLEEQKAQAQERIEEQKQNLRDRATGFLRGLVRPPDTMPTPPPPDSAQPAIPVDSTAPGAPADSVRPDTLAPDTLQPDTLAPDSVRPDTLAPDSVRPDTLRPDTVPPDTLLPDTLRPDTLRRRLRRGLGSAR